MDDPLSQVLYQITEPILGPIRRLLPAMGGFDFSPMIALIVLNLIIGQLIRIL
jgi:YggT family protein